MDNLISGLVFNLPSIIVGSIIAGIVVGFALNYISKMSEERKKKNEIFELLIKTKNYNDINNINSLNLIPIIFKKNDNVVYSYRELVKEVNKSVLDTKAYIYAYNEVITQIGRDIGYYEQNERYVNDCEYLPQWVTDHQQLVINQQKLLEYQISKIANENSKGK